MNNDIQEIWPEGMPRPFIPYSPAIRAGDWIFYSGQSASDLVTGISEEAKVPDAFPYYQSPMGKQAVVIYRRVEAIAEAAGLKAEHVVRVNQWYKAEMRVPDYQQGSLTVNNKRYVQAKQQYFRKVSPPSTGIGVRGLLVEGDMVEADFTATLSRDGELPIPVSAPGLPKPSAGHSEGVKLGNWLFLSGDLASDWKGNWGASTYEGDMNALAPEARSSGLFWGTEPVTVQTEYILSRLDQVARAAGTTLGNAVKAYVYLADPMDYVAFEEIWLKWFPNPLDAPARLLIPNVEIGAKGCRIEIGMDLLMPEASSSREGINGGWAPLSKEPAAMRADDLVYFSGLMASAPGEGLAKEAALVPGLPYFGNAGRQQMEVILAKAQRICDVAQVQLTQIVKATLYFTDLNLYAGAMEAWNQVFGDTHKPAMTVVEINNELWVPGCGIMADFIMYDPREGG